LTEEALLDRDVFDGRSIFGHRRCVIEVHEAALRFVVHHVGELLRGLLAIRNEREHRFFALDGALFATEACDVTARSTVRRLRVDERALALVGAEVTDGLFVVLRRVLEGDGLIETNEGRLALSLHDAKGLHRCADRAGFARVGMNEDLAVWY